MQKIEKELQNIKNKSKEHDSKLTQDTRIIGLEQNLQWFKTELAGV